MSQLYKRDIATSALSAAFFTHCGCSFFSNLVSGKFAERAEIVKKSVKIVFDKRFKIVAVFSDKIDRFLPNFFVIRLGASELHLEDRQFGHSRRTLAETSHVHAVLDGYPGQRWRERGSSRPPSFPAARFPLSHRFFNM